MQFILFKLQNLQYDICQQAAKHNILNLFLIRFDRLLIQWTADTVEENTFQQLSLWIKYLNCRTDYIQLNMGVFLVADIC